MSIVIRRVENICRKKHKSKSTIPPIAKKDVLEDDPSKFTVVEDFYSENFPPLRPVYRKDIFGTPIVFRATNGIDYYEDVECNVQIHCITFMREYRDKSFEELRWEDYSCGRKEVLHYEENGYLKSLSMKQAIQKINYEFFDPAPKNIPVALTKKSSLLSVYRNTSASDIDSKKNESLSKSSRSVNSSVKSFGELFESEKSYSNKQFLPVGGGETLNFNDSIESAGHNSADNNSSVKEFRPRSILTYVDKSTRNIHKNKPTTINSSEVCLNLRGNLSRQENIEMMKNNLLRYFEQAEPSANMPYDLIAQNPKFYLPCAEIGFVYQNARPSRTDKAKSNKMELNYTSSESNNDRKHQLKQSDTSSWKYTCNTKIRKEYFWRMFHPYYRNKSCRGSRAKCILAGIKITS